jgi:hypothetical protein
MIAILKQSRRYLRRNPLLTLLAGIVLAVGFSGSTLAYTVMLAMLSPRTSGLRAMQYATIAEEARGGGFQSVTWKTYEHLRQSTSWSDPVLVAYAEPIRARVHFRNFQQELSVAAASNGFFTEFAPLEAGTDFSSAWKNPHGDKVVILSRRLAEHLFSAPSDAIDQNILLNDQAFRVIGVSAGNFSGLWSSTDAWVPPSVIIPLAFGGSPADKNQAGSQQSPVFDNAEVWEGVPMFFVLAGSRRMPLEQLRDRLKSLVRSPEELPKNLGVTDGLSKDPIMDMKIRSWARLALLLSMALIFAGGLNYCGLLLAQVPRYFEEVRLKRVLGASVWRILLDNMWGPVMTVFASVLVAACSIIVALSRLGEHQFRFLQARMIPWHTLIYVLGIQLALGSLLGVLIALLPSVRLLRESGAPRMGYTTTAGKKTNAVLHAIIAGQMASCILVFLIAGMIISAVRSLSKTNIGFESAGLKVIEVGPASNGAPVQFSTGGKGEFPLAAFTREVVENSGGKVPQINVSAASCAPLVQTMRSISIQRLDRDLPPRSVHFCAVSQQFFQALGNPIVAGTGFSSNLFTGDVSEAVINSSLAKELWPEEDPLHHVVRIEEPSWGLAFVAEVVGVAQDMRFSGLTSTPDPTVFLPLRGNAFTLSFPLYFLAKGMQSPDPIEAVARQQARVYMPSLDVNSVYHVDQQLRQSFMEQEAQVWFCITGAALVAIIAYLGLYGVLLHLVNSKRKELAIRACFGASRGELKRIVVRQALQCSLVATIIALVSWKPVTAVVAGWSLGKVESPWQSAVAIAVLCLVTAVCISLLPASAAARVSPAETLKEQ